MKLLKQVLPPLLGLGLMAIIVGLTVVIGAYYYLKPGLPSAETLREVKLQTPLRIYSRDGRLMAQIGEKRRTPVEYEFIPDIVINAFLAAEDDRFFEHPGFDYQGVLRAGFNLLRTGTRSQGGSTITQQLARVYFLTRERTFVRKAKELFLAFRIENEFSKEEILSLYLNKIFFGQRAYGVGAAAEVYFGKTLPELSLAEAATIAGMPKAPSVLNPVSSPKRATERRAYVLRRMLELRFATRSEYDQAIATPMQSHLYGPIVELRAPYVTEMVRADMVNKFGLSAYTDGYKVFSTIDSRLQSAAQLSLRKALLEYDRRHGYRGPVAQNLLQQLDDATSADPATPDRDLALQKLLDQYPVYRDMHLAVVLNLAEDNSGEFFVRNFGRQQVPWDRIKWRVWVDDNTVGDAQASVDEVLAVGDLVYLLRTVDNGWQLAQMPEAQGAFVAVDPNDGATVALTGGFDFSSSKFNRAVQAKRQPGSNFKPFVYSAALENGFTVASIVNDAPVVFADATLEDTWRPENYSRRFHGPTRMREGLVKSMNLVSVRLLLGMGIRATLKHIRPFGFPESALPRDPSLALGSGGASPWDIASGYTTFANGGFHVDRYMIERIENSSGEIVFWANPRYVCSDCAPVPESEPADREGSMSTGTAEPATGGGKTETVEADSDLFTVAAAMTPDTEIPPYADVAEMIAHATDWRPSAEEAPKFMDNSNAAPPIISPQNAYLIYDMMRDVIRRGTGRRIRELGRKDLAGKTGTSNERRDTWFSGFNGDLVATAWIGFDQERSLGATEEGSRTALPIWKYFMADVLDEVPDATIPRPPGLVTVRISSRTGLLAPAGSPDAIFEIFREDHIPTVMADSQLGSAAGPVPDTDDADDDIF